MTDLEGLANILLDRGLPLEQVESRLADEVQTYKNTPRKNAERFAEGLKGKVEVRILNQE